MYLEHTLGKLPFCMHGKKWGALISYKLYRKSSLRKVADILPPCVMDRNRNPCLKNTHTHTHTLIIQRNHNGSITNTHTCVHMRFGHQQTREMMHLPRNYETKVQWLCNTHFFKQPTHGKRAKNIVGFAN